MNFKHPFDNQPIIASLTLLIEKSFPFFSIIYQTSSIKPTYIIPNTVQTVYFLLKKKQTFFA